MAKLSITKARADELIKYLPVFSIPGRQFITGWSRGTQPMPDYSTDVEEFFHLVGQEWWMDPTYDPIETQQMLEDEQFVNSADVDSIKKMLTWCFRGERFADGFWGSVLIEGKIQRLLTRLEQLRSTLPDTL